MKKRFLNFSLIGALLLGSAVSFVGCKDYDDDIDNLQKQIDDINTTLKALQSSIDAGEVIESVTSDGNGGVIIKTSKDTYTVAAGKDGVNGVDGESTIISIGENGNWYINDVDTGLAAAGNNGEKGDQGDKGDPGAPGENGKDGKYYYPNSETETWWVYEDGVATDTNQSYVPAGSSSNAVVAIWDNDTLTLQNVAGVEGDFVIYLTAKLRSMVFAPRAYYEGIPVIDFSALGYTVFNADGTSTSTTGEIQKKEITAKYHLNPSTVQLNGITDFKFYLDQEVPNYQTRATANQSLVTPSNAVINDGILTVNVNIPDLSQITHTEKDNSRAIYMDMVALQANVVENGDATNEIITSDYAGLYKSVIEPIRFYNTTVVNENGTNRHYRRYRTDIQDNAAAYIDTNAELVYNNQNGLNLSEMVKTCYVYKGETTHNYPLDTEAYGLTYNFELVTFNRTNEANETTDQKDFAEIKVNEDGEYILYANWTKATNGDGAFSPNTIGRTPLIRVELLNGNTRVLVGFMLAKIINQQPSPIEALPLSYSLKNVYVCENTNAVNRLNTTTPIRTTTDQMNQIYHTLGIANDVFHATYDINNIEVNLISPTPTAANIAKFTNVDVLINTGGQSTHVLEWTIENVDLWTSNTDTYEVEVTYPSLSSDGDPVIVPLKLTVERATAPTLVAKYDFNWDNNVGLINVRVPNEYDGSSLCIFDTNINDLYKVSDNNNKALTGGDRVYADATADYFFSTSNAGTKSGYSITVSTDRTVLYANGTAFARINNNTAGVELEDRIIYEETTASKVLLMANTEYQIVAAADLGCVINDITTFTIRFVNPLVANDVNTATFYDAETNGNAIDVLQSISLSDWRTDENGNRTPVIYGQWLYNYYDVNSRYQVVTSDIKFQDTNGVIGNLPYGAEIYYGDDINGNVPTNVLTELGITTATMPTTLYYKNGGTPVQGGTAYLIVPVRVNHKWGYVTETMRIAVKPGVQQN